MAESGFVGQKTSPNIAFSQGAKHVANAAKGKDSAGPVRRRRKTGR